MRLRGQARLLVGLLGAPAAVVGGHRYHHFSVVTRRDACSLGGGTARCATTGPAHEEITDFLSSLQGGYSKPLK